MFGMFDFFSMANNYEDRKVDNYDNGLVIVDTCSVTDGQQPFETGVKHPEYNDGKWVIVQSYDTKEESQEGHNKWVKLMTSDDLPEYLIDCCNSGIAQFGDAVCGELFSRFPRQTKE